MSRSPTIRDARYLAKTLDLDGVVIIAIGEGKAGAASYGRTMAQCRALAKIIDRITDQIERGEFDVSMFRVSEETPVMD